MQVSGKIHLHTLTVALNYRIELCTLKERYCGLGKHFITKFPTVL